MEKKEKYTYPDINNELTISFINKNEPFKGYWERSEKYILHLIKKYIQDNITNKKNSWFLDAGCGDGRLLCEFEKYFDNIIAIDPTSDLIRSAIDKVKAQGFSQKVIFKSISIEELDIEKKIDVILCSHVLQHVNTAHVPLILKKFKNILKKDGLLFIMTCHSTKSYDYYAKAYFKDSELVEKIITKEEFNSLIFNESKILPIHFFSKRNIIKLIESFDFKILDFKSFHILGRLYWIDKIIDRDKIVNSIPFLQKRAGRDMFIAAKLDE